MDQDPDINLQCRLDGMNSVVPVMQKRMRSECLRSWVLSFVHFFTLYVSSMGLVVVTERAGA